MYIGVDIGGTNTKVGIISKAGRLVASYSFKTKAQRSYEEVEKEIIQSIYDLCENNSIPFSQIKGVGFGIPGVCNSNSGIIIKASNLGWYGIDFSNRLSKILNKKVAINNDANCAAVAEQKFGSCKQYKNVIFITLGTGIGSGIIIDGKLYEGNGCAGGECGHMVIVHNGDQCACGNKGCWERYASASALTRRTVEMAQLHPESKLNEIIAKHNGASAATCFEAERMGDAIGKQLVDEYIEYVCIGLINLTQIFHPEVFVIGGGVSNEGNGFIKPLNQRLNKFIKDNSFYPTIEIKKAVLGNDAGMIGAASLVME